MEPKRGLFAGGGTTVRLPRQIPFPQAMEFLLCADLIPAERAYEMGLLNAIVPRDELLDKAYEFAAPHHRQRAARGAGDEAERVGGRSAMQRCKERATTNESHSSRRCIFQTEDAKEGPKAFAEKRPPNWQGEVRRAERDGAVGRRPGRRASSASGSARGTRRTSATPGAPEPLDDVGAGRARARPTTAGVGAAVLEQLDSARDRLLPDLAVRRRRRPAAPNGSASTRARATTRASAARRRRCSCSDAGRARSCAARRDLALVIGAEALATQRQYKKRGRALPVLVQARREAAVPVGGAVPTRSRSRTRCSRRGSRSRCSTTRGAAHLGDRPRRVPRASSASMFAPMTDDRGARTRTRGSRSSGRVDEIVDADARQPAWSATRTRSTWSR